MLAGDHGNLCTGLQFSINLVFYIIYNQIEIRSIPMESLFQVHPEYALTPAHVLWALM